MIDYARFVKKLVVDFIFFIDSFHEILTCNRPSKQGFPRNVVTTFLHYSFPVKLVFELWSASDVVSVAANGYTVQLTVPLHSQLLVFFFLPTRPKEFVYITDNLYAIMNFISRRIAPLWLVLLECVLLSTAEEGRLDYLLYNVLKYNTAVSCSVIVLIIDEKCAVGLLGCLIIGY